MLESESVGYESKLRPTENLPIRLITDPEYYSRQEAPKRPGEVDPQTRLSHIEAHKQQFGCSESNELLGKINEITSNANSDRTRTYIDQTTKDIIFFDTKSKAVVVVRRGTIQNLEDPPPIGEVVTAFIPDDGEDYVLKKLDGISRGTPWGRFKKESLIKH